MRKAVVFTLVLGIIDLASAVTHSMHFVYTASSGITDFPEFVAVGLVDGEQFVYFDNKINKMIPRQDWMAKSEGADYWDRNTQIARGTAQTYRANIDILKQRFNQTGGVHTVQRMYGCEWDDETGVTDGMSRDGYDGEDFIVFDLKSMRYIAPVPQAVVTKRKWEGTADPEQRKAYLTQECIGWLKKYVTNGKSSLERKVPPEVSLFQKSSSPSVTCQATGFYPKGVMLSWEKDGQAMYTDVESGETVPNGDGTFQIRSTLTVSAEDLKNHKFSCIVDHSSLKEKMVKHWVPEGGFLAIIIGCVVAAVLVILAVVRFFVWKKNKQGYGKTSTSDTDSEQSGQPAAKA